MLKNTTQTKSVFINRIQAKSMLMFTEWHVLSTVLAGRNGELAKQRKLKRKLRPATSLTLARSVTPLRSLKTAVRPQTAQTR